MAKADKQDDTPTEVRVLVATQIDGIDYAPNDVATLPAQDVAGYAGSVDADPAAVAYAKSLKPTE